MATIAVDSADRRAQANPGLLIFQNPIPFASKNLDAGVTHGVTQTAALALCGQARAEDAWLHLCSASVIGC
jgi:hypothetical protein